MRDRSCLRGIALALVALAALAAGFWLAAPAEAQGTSSVWRPTNGSTVQVEPIGFATASGYQDARMRNCIATTGAASTIATNGFLYTQSGAGPPTGVPAVLPTGSVPLYVDVTNFALYEYSGGAWHSAGGTVSLQTAYNGGNTIVEAAAKPVAISNVQDDTTAVLTVSKAPASVAQVCNGLEISMGVNTSVAATDGAALKITDLGSNPRILFADGSIGSGTVQGASDQPLAVLSGAAQPLTLAGYNSITVQEGNSQGRLSINNRASGGGFLLVGGTDASGAPATCAVAGGTSTLNGTPGAPLTISGGLANQAADSGGSVSLQTAITGNGTTLVDRVKANAVAKSLTNNTLTNILRANPTGLGDDVCGFQISYTVRVSDSVGHHNQVESGIVAFAAGSNNGILATPIVSEIGVPARYLESGTLTVTFDVSLGPGNVANLKVNVNSSLTATTETITYTLINNSDMPLSVQ